MRIKAKRIIFIIINILGIIWNVLCLKEIIPLKYFTYSIIWMLGFFLVLEFVPLIFSMYRKLDEKSNYIKDLKAKEKLLAGISFVFVFAWMVTIVPCILY